MLAFLFFLCCKKRCFAPFRSQRSGMESRFRKTKVLGKEGKKKKTSKQMYPKAKLATFLFLYTSCSQQKTSGKWAQRKYLLNCWLRYSRCCREGGRGFAALWPASTLTTPSVYYLRRILIPFLGTMVITQNLTQHRTNLP